MIALIPLPPLEGMEPGPDFPKTEEELFQRLSQQGMKLERCDGSYALFHPMIPGKLRKLSGEQEKLILPKVEKAMLPSVLRFKVGEGYPDLLARILDGHWMLEYDFQSISEEVSP